MKVAGKKIFEFFTRAAIFVAIWWCFVKASGWLIFHYVHDIESVYWSIGLVMATPFVVLVWMTADIIFLYRGASIEKLWRLVGISLITHMVLSPLWCGAMWVIDKHITHFIRSFYFILS